MEWLVDVLPQVARVCLVVIFPFSGLDKIFNWSSALKQAESSFLPGGPVLLVLAMMVEFVAPVCIVSGWYGGQPWLPALLGLPEELRPCWRPDFSHSRQQPDPGDRACGKRHQLGRRANSARLTARRPDRKGLSHDRRDPDRPHNR